MFRNGHQLPVYVYLTFAGLLFGITSAFSDPCEARLRTINPGTAAAAGADEAQAREKNDETFEHALAATTDDQEKERDAAKMLREAARHHKMEAALYRAGAIQAMLMGNIPTANYLAECDRRRTGQDGINRTIADINEKVAEHIIKADPVRNQKSNDAGSSPEPGNPLPPENAIAFVPAVGADPIN